MPDHPDPSAHRPLVAHQIGAEHLGFTTDNPQESGTGPQQAGLTRPVRAHDDRERRGLERERHAGEHGKPPREYDGLLELGDGRDRHRSRAWTSAATIISIRL